MVNEHLSGYQARDDEVVDYQMYPLAETGLWFRGPAPGSLRPQAYFCCLGGAQTFGCFCERPYARLLSERIQLPQLNLGYGGAGPFFFLKQAGLRKYINASRFVIVQIMSGRSESNSRFDSGGLEYLTRRRDGRRFAAASAWRSVLEGNYYWMKLPCGQSPARRLSRWWGRRQAERLVAETRANWLANFHALLDAIQVPTVLFWYSKRAPDYTEQYRDVNLLLGEFPQLVNREMVDSLRRRSDEYVECITGRGSPQPLVSRHTGQPCEVDLSKDRADFAGLKWTQNAYYPSPEMHEDAAEALAECLRRHPEWLEPA